MSHGLQIFNEAGELIVSLDSRLARITLTITLNIQANSSTRVVNIPVPGFSDDGTWFAIANGVFYFVKYNTGSIDVYTLNKSSAYIIDVSIGRF